MLEREAEEWGGPNLETRCSLELRSPKGQQYGGDTWSMWGEQREKGFTCPSEPFTSIHLPTDFWLMLTTKSSATSGVSRIFAEAGEVQGHMLRAVIARPPSHGATSCSEVPHGFGSCCEVPAGDSPMLPESPQV